MCTQITKSAWLLVLSSNVLFASGPVRSDPIRSGSFMPFGFVGCFATARNKKLSKMQNGSADPSRSQSNTSSVRASAAGSSQDPSSMHFSQAQNHTVQEDMAEALQVTFQRKN